MTERPVRLLRAVLCLLVLFASVPAAGAGDDADSQTPVPPRRQTVLVGADQDYPPFEYLAEDGQPTGFNIDLLKALAEVMGLDLDIRTGSWNSIRTALEQGRLDMVSGMYYSRDRDSLVDFSVPFIIVYQSMFVRTDSPLKSLEELKNKEVIVQQGDIMHDYVTSINLTDKIITVDNTLDGLRLLAAGQHDCALLPKLQGQYLLNKYSITNVDAAGPAILAQEYCFAVAEGNARLLSTLDQGLKILKASGKYKAIREKWFGVIEQRSFEPYFKLAVGMLVSLVVLLLSSWFWNWSLRRHVRLKTAELATELSAHERTLVVLKDREAHLRALVESSSDAILALDRQLRMTDCNPAFVSRFGYAREEIATRSLALVLPGEDSFHEFERAVFSEVEKDGAWRGEWEFRDKEGRPVPMETTISEKILPDGRLEGYVAIMRDITKRREAEEEKAKLESQLRQVQKMEAIGTLAGGIAHDFNNILSSIIGYAELSRRAIPRESPAREDLEEVLEAADRAKSLVKQILTYSRQSEQERRPVSLGGIVRDSVRLLRATLPATLEIRLDLDVEHDTVLADANQINQVLINLATNAAHAIGAEPGLLEISLNPADLTGEEAALYPAVNPGRYLELVIRDNGHGMDPSVLERIFDPFFTTKRRGEGTGMGLSVVHGIVKDHGGFIRVESRLGVGTAFHVCLPRYDGATDTAGDVPGPIIGGNERILLVDDEDRIANAWKRILMSLGYDVITATGSKEALSRFRESPQVFDLVVTDLSMPHMSGLELTRELIRTRPDIPIILYTGFSDMVNESDAESLGVRRFLYKPVSTAQMADSIRRVLDDAADR